MKIVLNILLVALIAGLGYLLYDGIKEPIEFQAERDKREGAVISRLEQIRDAQEMHRNITGKFAGNFDSLSYVLQTGNFRVINVSGDPDDPSFDPSKLTYDTLYFPAIDSVKAMGINLDSLRYVPFSKGENFEIKADTLIYQKTKVQVVEVGVSRTKYMGKFADMSYTKYDNLYEPRKFIKFGDMNKPNMSGNWE